MFAASHLLVGGRPSAKPFAQAPTRPGAPRACRSRIQHRGASISAASPSNAPGLQMVCFDCDGVLVDTERDGHRVSFNEAFKLKGLGQHEWSVEQYGRLLETGGGKERMMQYFQEEDHQEPFKSTKDAAQRAALIQELHLLKTDLFMQLVETGAMALRPGVERLVGEALAAGVTVVVCSTSNERAVSTIVRKMLGPAVAARMRVFAGDVVPKKKPDPAIYLLAAQEMGVDPANCAVIEDSHIGLRAAKAAGMRCYVTKSSYTAAEDFTGADAVFDCIGDAGQERFSLSDLQRAVADSGRS